MTRIATEPYDLFINSEGDAFVDGKFAGNDEWQPESEVDKAALAGWEVGMGHFRNWARARAGGSGSDTRLCWMPNAFVKDGAAFLRLSAEFSAAGTDWVSPRDGMVEPGVLKARLEALLAGGTEAPAGVEVAVVETVPAYFEAVLESRDAEAVCRHAIRLSPSFEADPVAAAAHEVIL